MKEESGQHWEEGKQKDAGEDSLQRSGLPARDFAALVSVSHHTLYAWKRRFEQLGPAGLMDQPRGAKRGSRLPARWK